MAKADAADENTEESGGKKSKKGLILILVGVVLLIGAAAAYFLVLSSSGGEEGEVEEEPVEEVVITPPEFVIFEPFVVNLAKPDVNRYFQVGITYEVKDKVVADQLENYMPVIRSRVLMVLAGKNKAELTTIEGKQRLMDQLVEVARFTIDSDGEDPTKGVRDVHFSSFVIQ